MGLFKKKALKKQQKRQAPVIESLEPRILLSADLPGLDVPDFDPDDPLNADVDQILARAYEAFEAAAEKNSGDSIEPAQELPVVEPVDEPDVALPSHEASEDVRHELIIVDPKIPDYEKLLTDVSAVGGDNVRLDVVLIDPQRNGVEQITQLLLRHSDLDAIHLISHGGAGEIKLGSEAIDLDALQRSGDLVRSWGDALSADGDILIYGCNLAASETGEALVDTLASLTGADVAASDDLTGHESLGGDWHLEHKVGSIETAVAVSGEAQEAWQAVLAIDAEDAFSGYPVGDLDGNAGGAGFTDAWNSFSGSNNIQVVATGLTHPTSGLDAVDAVQLNQSGLFDSFYERTLASPYGAVDETIWVSFLVEPQEQAGSGSYMGVVLGDGGYFNTNQLFFGYEDSTYKMNNWSGGGSSHVSATPAVSGETAFLVLRLDMSSSGPDTATLFVNPNSGEPTPSVSGTTQKVDLNLTNLDTVTLVGGAVTANPSLMGGLRIGSSFADVAPAGNIAVVTTTNDNNDAGVVDGNLSHDISWLIANQGTDNRISLREAIIAANNTTNGSSPDEIHFEITDPLGGNGAHTINVSFGGLPDITDAVIIDGTTDSDFGTTPIIELDGSAGGSGGFYLTSGSDGSTIRGFVINDFTSSGIRIDTDGNTIVGNYLGTNVAGTVAEGNSEGIWINGGANNVIGGTSLADANVISGNTQEGIQVEGVGATGTVIQGNFIGTNPGGDDVGNLNYGVLFNNGANDAVVGGTAADAGNVIAHNDYDGVTLYNNTTGHSILGNSIHSNAEEGIDLDDVVFPSMPLANDAGDGDGGNNNQQNFPVLSTAATNGIDSITIDGTLNSTANSYFRIEFFASAVADGSGHGEGQTYLGYANVATDGSGNATINANLSVEVSDGAVISATATKSDATYTTFTDTSEFAANISAATPPVFWDYHHDIDLGVATPMVDYPIKVELVEGANGFSHANAQPNGEDLRFYDAAGNELSYWIEDWNPAGTSVVWVEVANPSTTNIDLYYGNSDVAAASDPDATFLFFDDFADGTVGSPATDWTPVGGATSGTQPSIQDDAGNLVFSDGANSGGPVVSTGNWSDVVVSQDFRTINPGDTISHAGLIARYEDANNLVYGGIVDKDIAQIWYREAGTFTQIGSDWSITGLNLDDGNWHSQELRLHGDTVELYIDGSLIGSASLAGTGSAAGTNGQTGFWSQYSNYEAYRDNHIVRSYDGGTGDIATAWVDEGFTLDENSPNSNAVGSVLAFDPNVADVLSYSITAGNTGGAFAIDGDGQITVDNSGALDFETNPNFTLTVEVDDGNGGTDTQLVAINLTNIQPVISASGNASVDEDAVFTLNLGADEHVDMWTINWGDGNIETVAGTETSATHTYSNGGFTNNITVSATDVDGTVHASDLVVPGLLGTDRLYRLEGGSGNLVPDFFQDIGLNWSLNATLGPGGLLYVGEYNGTSDRIHKFDPVTGNHLGVFVASGAAGLNGPAGMEFGPDGNLYVASNFSDEILRFDGTTGAPIGTGVFVTANSGGLDEPDDITFGPDGDLYVTSFNTNQVLRYDGMTGEFKEIFVEADPGKLNAPSELVFGPDGKLYVTGVSTNQVVRYHSDGSFDRVFTSGVTMNQPRGAVFGPDGDLYVADVTAIRRFDGTTGIYSGDTLASTPDIDWPTQFTFLPSHQVLVNPINDAPVVSAPGSALNATEQTNLSIEGAGFSVDDVDAGMGTATATLIVGEGILTVVVGDSGVSIDSGDGTGTVTLSGRVSDLDKLLTGTSTGTITYFNGSDTPGASTTLTVTVDDGGDTGADPGISGTGTSEEGSNGVTINITSTNDAATIGGVDAANLTEDTGSVNGYLSASGTLTATDVDNPDDTFTAAFHRGSLGDLTIDGSGNWTYTVDNSLPAIQALAAGSTVNDVITVSSIDGTTHDVTITITGNAAPTAVDDTYTVDEDGALAVDWWDSDWSRRSVITFDNSGQAETLTDMPVLVVLNSGNINYSLTNDDGSDLRFFDANGNALAYDIEEWNESGDSYVWVKVPQITGGSNTDTITMYWGNAAATSAEDASAVWSNGYAAVHHLHDDFNDATVQRNTGTNSGSADTDGQVGDGQLFDGADDFVSLGDDASIQDIFDGGGTVSAWIYATGWGEGDYGRIFDKSGNTTTIEHRLGAGVVWRGSKCAAFPARLLRHHGSVVHGYQQHQSERVEPCLADV